VNNSAGAQSAVRGQRRPSGANPPSDTAYRIEATFAASNCWLPSLLAWKHVEEMLTGQFSETSEENLAPGGPTLFSHRSQRCAFRRGLICIWYCSIWNSFAKVCSSDRAAELPEGLSKSVESGGSLRLGNIEDRHQRLPYRAADELTPSGAIRSYGMATGTFIDELLNWHGSVGLLSIGLSGVTVL